MGTIRARMIRGLGKSATGKGSLHLRCKVIAAEINFGAADLGDWSSRVVPTKPRSKVLLTPHHILCDLRKIGRQRSDDM